MVVIEPFDGANIIQTFLDATRVIKSFRPGDGSFEQWKGFTGKEYDPETGLYYFNARWYDQSIGRFISEDPVRDPNNPNLYTYARNNPLRFIDPTGLISLADIGLSTATTGLSSEELNEIQIDKPNSSAPKPPKAFISIPEVSAPSIPKTMHIGTSLENIKLSSFVAELKERYPGMEIKVLSENKLIIRTRNYNRGIVEIELLGLYLKGDTISIERISSIDSEISSENYSIYVRKDLNATQIQGDLDAGFSVFHNAVPVSLNLDSLALHKRFV